MKSFVLVPGLNGTGDVFCEQIASLEALGSGAIAETTRDDTIAGMVRRLLADAPDGQICLIGFSMGGYVALETARLAPDRIAGLALLDTGARADTPEATRMREGLIALAQAGRFEEVVDATWPRLVTADRLSDEGLRTRVAAMAAAVGPEADIRQQRAIIERRDQRELLARLEIPTLVLVGEGDVITPPELAVEMATAIAGATLTRAPACGHLALLEAPAAVTRALGGWLARI